jgi:hypothetical protein
MPEIGCQTDFVNHRPDILKEYEEIIDHYTRKSNIDYYTKKGEFIIYAYLEKKDITIVKTQSKNYYERGCNTVDYLSYSNIILIDIIDFLETLEYRDPNFLDTLLFDGMKINDFKLKFYD